MVLQNNSLLKNVPYKTARRWSYWKNVLLTYTQIFHFMGISSKSTLMIQKKYLRDNLMNSRLSKHKKYETKAWYDMTNKN